MYCDYVHNHSQYTRLKKPACNKKEVMMLQVACNYSNTKQHLLGLFASAIPTLCPKWKTLESKQLRLIQVFSY